MRHKLTTQNEVTQNSASEEIMSTLKKYREEKGISQADAARHLGIKYSVLSRLERGATNAVHPLTDRLTRLLSVRFIVIPEYLYEKVNELVKTAEGRNK